MAEYYDVTSRQVFSLKSMCAVKVVQQVLVASGIKAIEQEVEEIALKTLRHLDLNIGDETRETLENLIVPMKMEMCAWYEMFVRWWDPIMTPLGTVNWGQSVKAILLNERMDNVTRYLIACDFCYEDQIRLLINMLTIEQWQYLDALYYNGLCSPFSQFWKRVHMWEFGCITHDGKLSQWAYNEGFMLALAVHNDHAITHFITEASPELVSQYICLPTKT